MPAGFEAPDSAPRFPLTGADTRAPVPPAERQSASLTASAIPNAGPELLTPLRFRLPEAPPA